MAKDTGKRILESALDLFSEKGYEGTNIREIAEAVGLGKSSVYRHFETKEDIWNGLLDEMIAYYSANFGSDRNLPEVPDSLDGLTALTMKMLDFTVKDGKVVKTRKLLSIEQFRDARARDLATKHFLTGLTDRFTPVFKGMMKKGLLKKDDPAILAFAYTAPISSLVHRCDREPDRIPEILKEAEAFSRHFTKIYGECKVRIETERLVIDDLRPSDRTGYFRNISHDRKVLETFVCNYAETPEEVDLERYLTIPDMLAVRLKETGEFIGVVLICSREQDSCEIGYGFGSAHWGKGYATEAVKAFIRYCFTDKGFRKVYASFFTGNEASRRVMEKCGMSYSHFVANELTYLGRPRDLTYYSITREEFLKRQ